MKMPSPASFLGYGVSVQQFEVLRILKTDSGLTAAQLVDHIVSDSSTMMSILKRLEAKVLIVRRPDENDRRNKLIYITGEGQALVDNLSALVDHYNRKLSECCTGKELAVFRHVLAKLFEYSQSEIENIPENGPVSKQNQNSSNN